MKYLYWIALFIVYKVIAYLIYTNFDISKMYSKLISGVIAIFIMLIYDFIKEKFIKKEAIENKLDELLKKDK